MRNVGVSVKNRQNATCGILVNVVVSVVKHKIGEYLDINNC